MGDLVKQARDLLDGVTMGPWWTDGKYDGRQWGCAIIAARTDCGPLPGNPTRGMVAWSKAMLNTEARRCEANARFIAATRDLVPAMADRIEALEAALRDADGHLTNLQPHIPQACYPGQEGFIDAHVDEAIRVIRAALEGK
jgi:hypothetical protein